MKLPAGMWFGAGSVAGGRRLAVLCLQLGFGVLDDGRGAGVGVASAPSVRFNAWSELAPQPASIAASSTSPTR